MEPLRAHSYERSQSHTAVCQPEEPPPPQAKRGISENTGTRALILSSFLTPGCEGTTNGFIR